MPLGAGPSPLLNGVLQSGVMTLPDIQFRWRAPVTDSTAELRAFYLDACGFGSPGAAGIMNLYALTTAD